MNVEPYIPLATALLTLLNTVLMILNRRRLHRVERQTNGMKMRLLADAEERGRRQGVMAAQVDPAEVVATFVQQRTEPPRPESH